MPRFVLIAVLLCAACGTQVVPGPRPDPTDIATAVNGICGVVPLSVPTSRIVFSSDLTDRCKIFDTVDNDSVSFRHEAGGFPVIYKRAANDLGESIWGPFLAQPMPDDVRVEADFDVGPGADNNEFGFSCRVDGPLNAPHRWYFLVASIAGPSTIYLMDEAAPPDFTVLGSGPANNIQRGLNHLRADCIGDSISLYVNGALSASAKDTHSPKGSSVGLFFRNLGRANASYLVTNVLITKP